MANFKVKNGIDAGGIISAGSFIKSGGTSAQFLKADGSVDSSTYLTTSGSVTANSFIPTSSTIPVDGMYLSGTDTLAFSTASTNRLIIDSNGLVGIGTSPSAAFHLSNGSTTTMILDGFNPSTSTSVIGRNARGTASSPAATQSGDQIFNFGARGYGASQYATSSLGFIKFYAAENFTNTSMATYLTLGTTASGGSAGVERLRIDPSGNLFVLGNLSTYATTTTSTNSAVLALSSGNASGTTSNSGNVTIDSGTATGTKGSILIGTTNTPTITIGRSSGVATTINGTIIPASKTLLVSTDIGSSVQAYDLDLTAISALTGTAGFLKTNGSGTWSVDTSTYLTANQSISLTGDITGSGTTSIATTLKNTGTSGTYAYPSSITTDAQGRVTSVTNSSVDSDQFILSQQIFS